MTRLAFGMAWATVPPLQLLRPRGLPSMAQCLLLAVLLHLLAVVWLGNTPGGSAAPGRGVWGSLNIRLAGRLDPAAADVAHPQPDAVTGAYTGPTGRAARLRWGGAVRLSEPAEPQATAGAAQLGTWHATPTLRPLDPRGPAPAPLPVSSEGPPTPAADARPSAASPQRLPGPSPERTSAPAPVSVPVPLAAPLPAGATAPLPPPPPPPSPPIARMAPISPAAPMPPTAALAPIPPVEPVTPIQPAPNANLSPAIAPLPELRQLPAPEARAPRAVPALAAGSERLGPAPIAAPAVAPALDAGPVATPTLQAPAAKAPALARPIRGVEPVRPVETRSTELPSPGEALAAPVAPTRAPDDSAGAATRPAFGAPDAGARIGADAATPAAMAGSAPRLNLELPRSRGGEISRQGSRGVLNLLPHPPEREDALAREVRKAARPDCRQAYGGMGLLGALPLAADALRGEGCRW